MLKSKSKWRADRGARALKIVRNIEAAIAALSDDDLLDLNDIFLDAPTSALATLSLAEMTQRKLTA